MQMDNINLGLWQITENQMRKQHGMPVHCQILPKLLTCWDKGILSLPRFSYRVTSNGHKAT